MDYAYIGERESGKGAREGRCEWKEGRKGG